MSSPIIPTRPSVKLRRRVIIENVAYTLGLVFVIIVIAYALLGYTTCDANAAVTQCLAN